MNFLSEILAFFDWTMFNSLTANAQALWFWLMYFNNRNAVRTEDGWKWPKEFTAPNRTLECVMNISRQQLSVCRNALIQAGLILYRKGKGNQNGIYTLIPFVTEGHTHEETQTETQRMTQIDTQIVTQNNTQTGRSSIHNPDTKGGDLNKVLNNKYKYKQKENTAATRIRAHEEQSGAGVEAPANQGQIPPLSSRTADTSIDGIFAFYEGNIGTVSPMVLGEVKGFLEDGLEPELVIEALKIAVRNNVQKKWFYARKILSDSREKKIYTVSAFQADRALKARPGGSAGASSPKDWEKANAIGENGPW